MALIVRIMVVLIAFLAASAAAGLVVVIAVMYPQWSDLELGVARGDFALAATFGFIFLSGFALLPAIVMALLTETFAIRHVLVYALGGAIAGLAVYLGAVQFDAEAMRFDGIVRRELEIMVGAGVIAGFAYWLIAGRNAGVWREPRR